MNSMKEISPGMWVPQVPTTWYVDPKEYAEFEAKYMITTQCLVYPIHLTDHPLNPRLKVGTLGPHTVVVGDHYDEGTLGFFIPAGVLVPDDLLDDMWLRGKLAGKNKNIVKAREREGVMSDGLFYGSRYFLMKDGEKEYFDSRAWNPDWKPNYDVGIEMGLVQSVLHIGYRYGLRKKDES